MGEELLSSSSLLVLVLGAWGGCRTSAGGGELWDASESCQKSPVAAGLSLPGSACYESSTGGGGSPLKIPCPLGSAAPAGTCCLARHSLGYMKHKFCRS